MKTFRGVIGEKLPIVLLVVATILAAFAYGVFVGAYQLFPYRIIADGIKTAQTLTNIPENAGDPLLTGFSEVVPENAAKRRIRLLADGTPNDPLLWFGGRSQFLDLCAGIGCLAVAYTDTGKVAHAWPYRPADLARAAQAAEVDEFPHELVPTFSFAQKIDLIGVSMYPNWDLLVTFHIGDAFPFAYGAARIDADGRPVWFRRDYSHHWPRLLADGTALVPALLVGTEDISFEIAKDWPVTLDCAHDRPYLDTVNIIDGHGRLLNRINVLDALLKSRFSPILQHSSDPCDPLHLNYVGQIGADGGGTWGMAPEDLVVSLLGLSAFAILDRESFQMKRLVTGSFFQQHAVTHLGGSRFLLLDNQGSDGINGPSRLLEIDLAIGRETTVFPNARTPDSLRGLFTGNSGKLDISPNRERAMVVFTRAGVAVEVRLSDGAALKVFTSLHNVSGLTQFDERRTTQAAIFNVHGLDYIHASPGGNNE